MGDSQIAGVWTHSECKLYINVLELRAVILALHHWAIMFDCYRQYHCCSLHQQTRWDHSHLLLQLVVDLFLWLQTLRHNSKSQTHSGLPECDSRPIVSAEPAHHDRVESPPRSCESDIQTVGNSSSGPVCHSQQHASSPVHVSSSRASGTGDK